MPSRRLPPALRRLVPGAALLLSALSPGRARADHTPETPITEDTAYTRERNHFRLGLWKLQYGVLDSLTVGTYWPPYIALAPNLHVKWRVFHNDSFALAAQGSFLTFDTARLESLDSEPVSARLTIASFEPLASYRFNDTWTLSGGLAFTAVRVDGQLEEGAYDGAGDGAVSNSQATATLEFRATKVTALVLHGRYLIAQRARATVDATIQPDAYTTVDAHGSATTSALDFPKAWSLVPSVAFSWTHLYLRAGVGYGNWSLPVANFVWPRKRLIPELDISWYF
jgi:hypothetical protein